METSITEQSGVSIVDLTGSVDMADSESLQSLFDLLIEQGKTVQAHDIQQAIDQVKQGGGAEKTLVGTIINLDRGKSK